MNHLVVFANPNPESFCRGIVDSIEKASKEKGIMLLLEIFMK